MEQADLVLAVVDLSVLWDDADERLVGSLDQARSIVVGNKSDLVRWVNGGQAGGFGRVDRHECEVSAVTGEGIDDLRARIQQIITGGEGLHLEEPVLATERQRGLVSEAAERAGAALAGAARHRDEELVCEDIRGAVQALGRITGEELTPDLLDEIFSRFCLGK
jgi:tRNA modification GTPase